MTPPSTPLTWGKIADEGRTAIVLRLVLVDRTITFPYSAFFRWELAVDDTEILTIHAWPQATVTVRGRNLAPLRDALDAARLEHIRAQGERAALRAGPAEPWIQGIELQLS